MSDRNQSRGNAEFLARAFIVLENEEELSNFLKDLCTTGELEIICQRLQVACLLDAADTYTRIAESTGASTATISRVKRALNYGADGYKLVFNRLSE